MVYLDNLDREQKNLAFHSSSFKVAIFIPNKAHSTLSVSANSTRDKCLLDTCYTIDMTGEGKGLYGVNR